MRNSVKAVLLSAFVLPGTGHFSLKRPVRGSVLLGLTLFCLIFLCITVFKISQELGAKIASGEMPYDVALITESVTEKLSGGDDQLISAAVIAIIVLWVFGVVDAFRISRQSS